MKTLKISLLLVAMILISCGPRVETQKMTDVDLRAEYDTYAYLPNTTMDREGNVVDDPVVNQSIIEAINQNMRQAGFELDRNNPDLLVLVTMETQTETRTTVNPRFAAFPYAGGIRTVHPVYRPYYFSGFYDWYGPAPFHGYDAHTRDYRTGTMIVYLVDRETQRTVWKGTSSKSLRGSTPEEAEDLINEMFEEFP